MAWASSSSRMMILVTDSWQACQNAFALLRITCTYLERLLNACLEETTPRRDDHAMDLPCLLAAVDGDVAGVAFEEANSCQS